jgi:protein SCO1
MPNGQLPTGAQPALGVTITHSSQPAACVSPPNGPNSEYFPNVVVLTHTNRKALFYDDLLRAKTVMINFMSIKGHVRFPVSDTIAKVQPHIGPRLGRDVFLYSITNDPLNDTPAALDEFAFQHGAREGWLFLTGEPKSIQRIKDSLFSRAAGHNHADMEDCSQGMIRYGNEAVGLWGSVPVSSRPEWIAQRVSWVESRPAPVGPFKRKGPLPRT